MLLGCKISLNVRGQIDGVRFGTVATARERPANAVTAGGFRLVTFLLALSTCMTACFGAIAEVAFSSFSFGTIFLRSLFCFGRLVASLRT